MQYVALEFHKELDKGKSKLAATTAITGNLVKDLFLKLSDTIQDQYLGLGCYAHSYRAKRVCKLIGYLTMPPAAAIALIFKTRKIIFKKHMIRMGKEVDPKLLPLDGEIKDVNLQDLIDGRLADDIDVLKNRDSADSFTARDLGIERNIIVLKNKKSPSVFINAENTSMGKKTINLKSSCHVFTYRTCHYNFQRSASLRTLPGNLIISRTVKF